MLHGKNRNIRTEIQACKRDGVPAAEEGGTQTTIKKKIEEAAVRVLEKKEVQVEAQWPTFSQRKQANARMTNKKKNDEGRRIKRKSRKRRKGVLFLFFSSADNDDVAIVLGVTVVDADGGNITDGIC